MQPAKEWKLLDFIPHAVEYLRFSANEDAIEIPLRRPELRFDCLVMANSRLVNRHVLSTFTGWGVPVHTVNLDNTKACTYYEHCSQSQPQLNSTQS